MKSLDVGNKNDFINICRVLSIPVLETYCIDNTMHYNKVVDKINYDKLYLIKPASDRTRASDTRRNFIKLDGCKVKEHLDARYVNGMEENYSFQIQEYIDYKLHNVGYFNYSYDLAEMKDVKIKTKQIINLSAINENQQCIHWGNSSFDPSIKVHEQAEAYCKILIDYCYQQGHRSHIGLDYGICNDRIFFLESNVRQNNGSRALHWLNSLGIFDINSIDFLFIRNEVVEWLNINKPEYTIPDEVKLAKITAYSTLYTSTNKLALDVLIDEFNLLSMQHPPVFI